MWKTFKNITSTASSIHWLWGVIAPSCGTSALTGIIGYFGKLPLMYIWVAMIAVFAFTASAVRSMQTFTDDIKQKREALFELYGQSFRITSSFEGDQKPFFNALNRAKLVFHDNQDVQDIFKRLMEEEGHDSILIPDLIEKMADSLLSCLGDCYISDDNEFKGCFEFEVASRSGHQPKISMASCTQA